MSTSTKLSERIFSFLFWVAVISMWLMLFFLSGCATATATDFPVSQADPNVQVQVVALDPYITFDYPIEDPDFPDNPILVGMQGQVVIHFTVSPPGWPVTLEQSPDLKNWVQAIPLYGPTLVGAGEDSQLFEATFQVLTHPENGSNSKQFFRASY